MTQNQVYRGWEGWKSLIPKAWRRSSGRGTPLVSVNMVTYNQEPFIRESIRSVLSQSMPDLELVIVDDGSTDDTPKAVAEFDDPRIVYVRQENQGPGGATNTGLATCRGRFVALFTGDDLCHPRRLELQLDAYAKAGGGIVFSNIDYVDEDGVAMEHSHFPKDFFAIPPMTRAEVLSRLFLTGNFIHPVTGFLELRAVREIGPLDPLLYQLQDYDLLIRLAKRYPFTFMKECTATWRIRKNAGNLSAHSKFRQIRSMNEYYLIVRTFFDDLPADLVREAFGSRFMLPDSHSPAELACEQAFLYLNHESNPLLHLLGLERLHRLLRDPATASLLAEKYNYRPSDYVHQLGVTDLLGISK